MSHEDLANPYEGVEAASSFRDREALERYRRRLLERTSEQAAFLARRLTRDADVLEVGCGNGRLLISLARDGVIAGGMGIDVAESRIAFARTWAAEEGLDRLDFEAADATTYESDRRFAAVVCITGAFGYFEPMARGLASRLLAQLHRALSPGGFLCLELYPHTHSRRLLDAAEGVVRLWQELPPEDPWRFYLSRLTIDDAGEILTHEKTFIHRVSGQVDSGRRERLFLYTKASITALLEPAGFRDIATSSAWGAMADEDLLIVTATRA